MRSTLLFCLLFAFSGCATFRGDHDWYKGPAHLKQPVKNAINWNIHMARQEGLELKWRWDKDRLFVKIDPTIRRIDGSILDGYASAGHAVTFRMANPDDALIRHEILHILFDKARIPYGGNYGDGHHNHPAWKAIKRKAGRGFR